MCFFAGEMVDVKWCEDIYAIVNTPRIYTYILRCTHDKCIIYFMFFSEIWFKHMIQILMHRQRQQQTAKKLKDGAPKWSPKYIFFQFVKVFDSGYFTTSLAWKSQVKAYTTRVGHGPFPTELQNETQSLEVRYRNFWDYRNAYYSNQGITEQDSAELVLGGWGFSFFGFFWGDEKIHAWELEAVLHGGQKIASYWEMQFRRVPPPPRSWLLRGSVFCIKAPVW